MVTTGEAGKRRAAADVALYADMFSALGTEPRLRIVRLLLSAHPEGLVVGEIQEELEIPNSTLSHHLESSRMKAWGVPDPAAARGSEADVERAFREAFLSWIGESACSSAFPLRLSTIWRFNESATTSAGPCHPSRMKNEHGSAARVSLRRTRTGHTVALLAKVAEDNSHQFPEHY